MKKMMYIVMFVIMMINNYTAGATPVIDEALTLIKTYEGFRSVPYVCPGGVKTIGYGQTDKSLISKGKITEAEAEQALLAEIVQLNNWIVENHEVELTDTQRAALISLIYNIGKGAYLKSNLKKCIDAGKPYTTIHKEWSEWRKAGGKILSGLVKRRAAELAVYSK